MIKKIKAIKIAIHAPEISILFYFILQFELPSINLIALAAQNKQSIIKNKPNKITNIKDLFQTERITIRNKTVVITLTLQTVKPYAFVKRDELWK
jgi:hypothetical protein